jgi:hypothetical protein
LSALPDVTIKPIIATSDPQPSANGLSGRDRLDSWKEIATYLRREVRTVQLWEKNEGLPVHRHFHKRLGSVYALRSEIDGWLHRASRTHSDEGRALCAPTRARNHVAICSLPPETQALGKQQQGLCEFLVARAIAALEQTNPGQIRIAFPNPAANGNQENYPATNGSTSVFDYLLRWSFRHDGDGLHVTVTLLFAQSGVTAWSQTSRCSQKDKNIEKWPLYAADQIAQCLWLRVISGPGKLT